MISNSKKKQGFSKGSLLWGEPYLPPTLVTTIGLIHLDMQKSSWRTPKLATYCWWKKSGESFPLGMVLKPVVNNGISTVVFSPFSPRMPVTWPTVRWLHIFSRVISNLNLHLALESWEGGPHPKIWSKSLLNFKKFTPSQKNENLNPPHPFPPKKSRNSLVFCSTLFPHPLHDNKKKLTSGPSFVNYMLRRLKVGSHPTSVEEWMPPKPLQQGGFRDR